MAQTILVLAANPKDTTPLRLDQEVREIDNGLQRARKRDEFILQQKWAPRPADVRRAMLDYKPNIVHFCGHGVEEEGIAFEAENGHAKLIGTEALAGFFALFATTVKCVVLNACFSEVQAAAIARHIPYVIGMKKDIGDQSAIEFAVAFYDALGAGESIEFAYKLACNAIEWSGTPEYLTPTLKHSIHIIQNNKTEPFPLRLTPQLPCLLLIDVSGSMSGAPIEALKIGLESFLSSLRQNATAIERVELAIVTFGDTASLIRGFTSVSNFQIPYLSAGGSTSTGKAINTGLNLIEEKLASYKANGTPYYPPFVLLVTDGEPSDDWESAVNRLHTEHSLNKLRFYAVGTGSININTLRRICPPDIKPLMLKDLRFSELFTWVSYSISAAPTKIESNEVSPLPPILLEEQL